MQGVEYLPEIWGTEAVKQCLTSVEKPDPGLHPGPLSFSTFQHLVAADAELFLPFIPICSLQSLLVFPSGVFWFFSYVI